MFSTTRGAATLSLLANMALVGLKLGVGLSIGSISVLSDALDSSVDLISAMIAMLAIRVAARPADRQHPYGHGKMENVSGVIESVLILAGAGLITIEAVHRLQHEVTITSPALGVVAMTISLAINVGTSAQLRRVARKTGSIALATSAWHRTSDIVTSLGVLLGLLLMWFTPWTFLDPAVALAIAAFIAWTAVRLVRRSFVDLLDVSLPEREVRMVRRILQEHTPDFVSYHSFRTRRAGSHRYVEMHLVLPRVATVEHAHLLTDRLEDAIEKALPDVITTIHIEPCDIPYIECAKECVGRQPQCYLVPSASMEPHPAGERRDLRRRLYGHGAGGAPEAKSPEQPAESGSAATSDGADAQP